MSLFIGSTCAYDSFLASVRSALSLISFPFTIKADVPFTIKADFFNLLVFHRLFLCLS